jgi:hypothetical protein
MVPAQQMGMAAPAGAQDAGPVGTVRNPVMTTVLSSICFIYAFIAIYSMLSELKAYLRKDEIQPWHIIVPFWNLVVLWIKTPEWVSEAKRRAGCANPSSAGVIMYVIPIVNFYSFANDLNEVWQAAGRGLPQG